MNKFLRNIILLSITLIYGCFDSIGGGSSSVLISNEELLVKSSPSQITADDSSSAYLFDGNTESAYAPAETKQLVVKFPATQKISRLKILGKSSYSVNVYKGSGASKEVVKEFNYTGSSSLISWNIFDSTNGVITDNLTIEITPLDSSKNGISEIEIWRSEKGVLGSDKANGSLFNINTAAEIENYSSKNLEHVRYFNSSGDISFSNKTTDNPASLSVSINIDPLLFKRAYLSYSGKNVKTPASIKTRINGGNWFGGGPEALIDSSEFISHAIEINPAFLKFGTNTIEFARSGDVSIKNFKIYAELENGYNLVSSVSDSAAYDRSASTNASLNLDSPALVIDFERKIEPDFLHIYFAIVPTSPFVIQYVKDNIWVDSADAIKAANMKTGWNKIKIVEGLSTDALKIKFTEESSFKAEISEIYVSGSPSANREIPNIVTSFPRNGEFFTRTASIFGFVKSSKANLGTDKLNIADKTVKTLSSDGTFSFSLTKEEAGFTSQGDDDTWKSNLIFNNGTEYSSNVVVLTKNINSTASTNTTGSTSSGGSSGSNATTDTDTVSTDTEFRTIIDPKSKKSITYQDVSLDIPAGAVDKATEIKIIPLKASDLQKLDPGMTNVTTPFVGYRFLPHGSFKKSLTLKLGYDKSKIPTGRKEKDISSFYFDENERRWKKLETVQIDSTRMMVLSATNHFTDIINATLTTPEHPDPLSYNPNSIKDIKAGDPSSGVNLIEAPKATNTGDAGLTYPIEIPKGRNGMQPDVTIKYSSGGGNSWLGLGWDIHVSSIAVDTTFGVPRPIPNDPYTTYTLDGAKLVKINETTFKLRVEGSFSRIIKNGNQWEVTDKNGTTSYYGETTNSRLTGVNTGQWYLNKVIDTNGNTINYRYYDESDGISDWRYLKEIYYTGINGGNGPYKITFTLDRTNRTDVTVSARMGFKTALLYKLNFIEVFYGNSSIRKYDLHYMPGKFGKTLLKEIIQYGANGTEFTGNKHVFDYYDDLEGGKENFTITNSSVLSSATHSADGLNVNGNFSLGISPVGIGKMTSVGGKIGGGFSDSFTKGIFIDIDGDGLTDYVYSNGTSIYYCKNISTPGGTPSFKNAVPISISTKDLGHEANMSYNFGFNGTLFFFGGNYAESHSESKGKGYLSDVNGDGLPDFVCDGNVYYNHGSTDGNTAPTFNMDSPIGLPVQTGVIDFPQSIPLNSLAEGSDHDSLVKIFYRDDPLLVWKAPFNGLVKISGDITLLPKTDTSLKTDDGVRVSIEKNGYIIWKNQIGKDQRNTPLPTVGTDSIQVNKGERIFFRVDSIDDGNDDSVSWNPVIEYVGIPDIKDENGFSSYKFNAFNDFNNSSDESYYYVPSTGIIKITGSISKTGATSDDVSVNIYRITESTLKPNGEHEIIKSPKELLGSITLNRGEIITNKAFFILPVSVTNNFDRKNLSSYSRDKILCQIYSDTPIDLTKISANLTLTYSSAEIIQYPAVQIPSDRTAGVTAIKEYNNTAQGTVIQVTDETTLNNLKTNLPISNILYIEPDNHPPYVWKSSSSERSGNATVEMSLSMLSGNSPDLILNILNEYSGITGTSPSIMDDTYSANITLAVKVLRDGNVVDVKKMTYPINKTTSYTDQTFTTNVDIQQGDDVFFIAASDQYDIVNFVQIIDPKITIGTNNFYDARTYLYRTRDKTDKAEPCAGGYRNWYYARYNPEDEISYDGDPINMTRVKIPEIIGSIPSRNSYSNDSAGDKLFKAAVDEANKEIKNFSPMTSIPGKKRWQGHDDYCYIGIQDSQFVLSSTRVSTKKYIPSDEETCALPTVTVTADNNGVIPGAGSGRGVSKFTKTDTQGGGFSTVVVDGNYSDSISKTYVDFFDLNGDRIPDVIKNGVVSYSKPDGSYESQKSAANMGDLIRTNKVSNSTYSFPGSISPSSIAEALNLSDGTSNGNSFSNPSPSGSFGYGDVSNNLDYIDVNGDGLPDKVRYDGSNAWVSYNLGYGFSNEESLNSGQFRINHSAAINTGVGISFDKGLYGGGSGVSFSQSMTSVDYIDVNGDGLPDRVTKNVAYNYAQPLMGYGVTGQNWSVQINTGNGFAPAQTWTGTDASVPISETLTYGLNGSVFIGGIVRVWLIGIILNGSIGGGGNITWNKSMVLDVNGDGYPDHVYFETSDPYGTGIKIPNGNVKVAVSNIGKTNLLRSVTRPLGGTITIDYKRAGNTHKMNQSRWTMSNTTIKDEKNNSYATKYDYEDGKYDRFEREFYGFAKVTETKIMADGTNQPLPEGTNLERNFITGNYFQKGLERETLLRDNASNNLLVRTISNYDFLDIIPNGDDKKSSKFCPLLNKTTQYYENGGTVSAIQSYEYDSYGNVKKFTDSGTNITAVTAHIQYEYNTAKNIVSKPKLIRVTDASGKEYRHRMGSYDGKGRLVQLIQTNSNSDTAVTDLQYDANGNLMRITGPSNSSGQRYSETYIYDTTGNIIEIKDSFGYSSRAKYDERWGKPLFTIDINNQYMTYSYDEYGRTSAIYSPNDLGSGRPTIEYRYNITTFPATCTTTNKPMPESNQTIDTVTEIDGLKRVTRTKMTAEVNGTLGMTVSGNIDYDNMGRVIRQGEPTFNTPSMQNATVFSYDVLGRKKTITFPDGTSIQNEYAINGSNLTTRTIDQKGRTKYTEKNIRGEITKVTEPATSSGQTITNYAYNPMGEITGVTDAAGNNTNITYDNFGRRLSINNPDTGLVEYGYDTAGNMTRKITPNQREKGTYTKYRYTFNRLDRIDYTDMPSVIYTYGNAGAGNNRAGRIATVENGDYKEERSYGKLGEITRSLRQIKVTTPAAVWKSYETKYNWDNMGRMQTITYPDGEVLRYVYNRGGLLKAAIGSTNSKTETYLKEIQYDQFGQRTKATYGNGTETTYSYDIMRRLQYLKTKKDAKQYQNIEYTYDNIGNITRRKNTDFITAEGTPKTSEQTYSYDEMERLKYSEGKYGKESWIPFNTTRENVYTNELNYNSIGNITRKVQVNNATYADTSKTVSLPDTTYTLDYKYESGKPHAVTDDGTRTYSYDPNGNMITRKDKATNQTRTMAWDEENRLTKVSDVSITEFKYDDTGTRIIKKGNSGEVVYVNQNYTVRDGVLASKHIFAGNTRVASKLDATEAGGTYYYHGDHLGSSSVVTAKDGSFHESLEYFPYGETWVHEKANSSGFTTPYQFTSKELDPETNLYYFGARYYDARLSRWVSPDPYVSKGKYFPKPNDFDTDHDYLWRNSHDETKKLPGRGGVFNTANLDAYEYGHNNPVRMIDPDGNSIKDKALAAFNFIKQKLGMNDFNGKGASGDWGYGTEKPVNGKFTQDFKKDKHEGIDIGAVKGTPINAAKTGTVLGIFSQPGYTDKDGDHPGAGNYIIMKNEDKTYSYYMHTDSQSVKAGDFVLAGNKIGTVGNSGNETYDMMPHLHYEERDSKWNRIVPDAVRNLYRRRED